MKSHKTRWLTSTILVPISLFVAGGNACSVKPIGIEDLFSLQFVLAFAIAIAIAVPIAWILFKGGRGA